MNKPTVCLLCTGLMPIVLALPIGGCATKGYVRSSIAPVDTKVNTLEAKLNDQINKEETDISRVEEKILTTDNRVAAAAAAAQQANASAAQANQTAQRNQSEIAANQTANQAAIAANESAIATLDKSMNYSLVANGDVTFRFNRSDLGKTDQAALDVLISQVQSRPRAVFELLGFTDKVGTAAYNLALSRRRAESVARYLVRAGIPLRGIHIIGLGEEPVPPNLLADVQAVDPSATKADSQRLARRVVVRIYTANASLQTSAAR
jgi:outer membrane protein OmpA-like peptidoglycan-associated protein